MPTDRQEARGGGFRPSPRPIGVYADQGAAFLILSEADLSCLADHRTFQVLRGKKALGLALMGEVRPIFIIDLEAELDLKISRSIEVLVIDPGVMRKADIRIDLVWP